ncbi:MAG: M67 family metallopeptidase [Bacteroidota bacterium]
MDTQIQIEPTPLEVIYEHAREAFPDECCGFLYGDEKNGRRISVAQRVDNAKEGDQRRRFEISPLDYLRAERYALERGLDLLGIYHSHPQHPAIASAHDLEKALPFFSYVIVSVMDGAIDAIQSWKLQSQTRAFAEEEVILPTDYTTATPPTNGGPLENSPGGRPSHI